MHAEHETFLGIQEDDMGSGSLMNIALEKNPGPIGISLGLRAMVSSAPGYPL